jgi:radical SAM superfamily enzyme YgiQ (UPF0313 family)
MDYVLPMLPGNKRSWMVTGALPALAALAPPHCDVTLLDENVEAINFEALQHFDIVGVTGMIVQRRRMHEILERLQGSAVTVVAGGPYVSVSEAEFVNLCDVRFVGEAEDTWPAFLTAFALGESVPRRYQQTERSDMQKVPAPRYDLLKAHRYMGASLQFSRGCPFQCEFCDIITIFGRRPRTKAPQQMLAEFEAIRRAGFRNCFLVDDNFIGNKRKAVELLRETIAWQERNGYPLTFSTEASINLADEPELLELMGAANFRHVFVGIESPRAASLTETKKLQNVRGDSLLSKLQRIRNAGLVINGGFIVGFDSDDDAIFDEQFDFIQRAGIAHAAVAILSPIPTTPLYARLEAEKRLDFSHPHVKFHPKGMSREALKSGYDTLMYRLYEPDAYFGRLLDGYAGSPAFREKRAAWERRIGNKRGIVTRFKGLLGAAFIALRLLRALMKANELSTIGRSYVRQWRRNRALPGKIAIPFGVFVMLCAEHWHFFRIAAGADKGEFGNVGAPAGENVLPAFEEPYRVEAEVTRTT